MSAATREAWTKPFHGVQHKGKFGVERYWATVCDYGRFAILTKWFPKCGFSALHSMHRNAAAARRAGDRYLRAHS